ncbi:hypothetical protein [Desertimonas flava]|nr:hypothetical protein [Desertimonas flava]
MSDQGEPTKVTIVIHAPPQPNLDPCARGAHAWAWLTAGGQQCAACGARR